MTSLGDFLRSSLNDPTSLNSLDDVFSEEPVPLSVFVQDAKFLRNPPLSEVQYNAVRAVERIYMPRTYEAMRKEFSPYWGDDIPTVNFITLQWG